MGKTCKKCGMASDRDDLCTWCNADLREPLKTQTPPRAAGPAPEAQLSAATTDARPCDATSLASPAATASGEQLRRRHFWVIPTMCAAGATLALIGTLVLIGMAASGPPPAAGDWKPFSARDHSFTAFYPAGWGEPSNSGSPGSYVLVDWRPTRLAKVSLEGTAKAGAIGDAPAALARASGDTSGPGKADLAMLDYFRTRTPFGKQRKGYRESEPQVGFEVGGVPTARVAYEYHRRVGLLTVRMKGMRWGFHQGDYGYHIYAEAPARSWATFEPIALKILAGVKFGGKL